MERIFQFERSFITAYKNISSSKRHVLPFTKQTKLNISLPNPLLLAPFLCNDYKKTYLLSPAVASIPYQPINVDYLVTEFSGHGVAFQSLNEGCVVKMILDNGSMATMMLPSGLITSYKVTMWHGGTLEMLHTLVSQERNGEAVIQGGVSSEFKCRSDGGIPWSPSVWSLHDVRGNSMESIQLVELVSRDAEDKVEVKYIVTLKEDTLRSELVISNLKSSNLEVLGSFASHLTLSSPEATYATGLEGSNIFEMPPHPSEFRIVTPDSGQGKESGSGKGWDAINNFLLSSLDDKNQKAYEAASKGIGKEVEEEEIDNYKHLAEKMSRIYTNAPRKFTIIDRGRRNSVVFGREGFDEVYFFSPGSRYESYSKYAYITIGPSAMLKPIILSPHGTWHGIQYLHNPNLSA